MSSMYNRADLCKQADPGPVGPQQRKSIFAFLTLANWKDFEKFLIERLLAFTEWILRRCLYLTTIHQRPGHTNPDMCLRTDNKEITE